MNDALSAIEKGTVGEPTLSFAALREIVGFDAYDTALARFGRRNESN